MVTLAYDSGLKQSAMLVDILFAAIIINMQLGELRYKCQGKAVESFEYCNVNINSVQMKKEINEISINAYSVPYLLMPVRINNIIGLSMNLISHPCRIAVAYFLFWK